MISTRLTGSRKGRQLVRYALTAEAMRRAEMRAVARGVPLATLMAHAGAAVAEEVSRWWPEGRVVVVAGGGNNGGDGWVAARLLASRGRDVRVLALVPPDRLRAEAAEAAAAALDAGVPAESPSSAIDLARALDGATVIVDAVLGIGASGALREPAASAIEAMDDADAPVLAVDVPSGIASDSGAALGAVARADRTVTFSALKPGLLTQPGRAAAGEIVIADVGLTDAELSAEGDIEVPERDDLAALLPVPSPVDHKGSRGRVLIVAGSARFTGAAVLAASGALRMGAGYVWVAGPPAVVDVVHAALPSAIAVAFPHAEDGSLDASAAAGVLELAAATDAVAIGPGLSPSTAIAAIVRELLAGSSAPVVVDADALNVLAGDPSPLVTRPAPTLVTPHSGELARLLGTSGAEVAGDRLCYASELTGEHLTCLLKGPGTVVACRRRRAIVATGGPELAKAGSGDVLAGMLATLLAQGLPVFEAAVLGAYLHGRAGELAADVLTTVCALPTDLPDFLPPAVAELL